MSKRAFIYTAGSYSVEDIKLYKRIKTSEEDIIICADGGYDALIYTSIVPDVVIGDFDSLKSSVPKEIEVVKYPTDKDKTDLEICIDYALERGCDTIFMLGALGGRIDHTIGSLCAMKYVLERGASPMILNGKSRIYLIDNEIQISRDNFDYVSLIPCTDKVTGITTTGLKYELNNDELLKSNSLGISNEFYGNTATVKIENGLLYVICTEE